ncbi:MAG: type VI secretion system baseplate subunit TssK [Acidobacteriaceae bacterium]|nr:type VI secretion system baseplate subunit TssK [Acidobacteriaceae bacterium]MBV9500664.1 type VI secretion system baseplate subunit TssK [Acidobacteriaceae bacterium]
MYLGPHHFQAQSRYFEDAINFATESLAFSPFGLLGYELNAEALRNGTVLLSHARGVFEDGLAFDMPCSDPLPEPRSVEQFFQPTSDTLLTYLAVPSRKQLGGNCTLDPANAANGTRFLAEERPVFDEITGGDEKPVRFGRKNIRFLFEGEKAEGWQRLPLARILRDGAGRFIFDQKYIPPVVRFSASETLMSMTRRLIDILTQKNIAFTGATQDLDRQQSGMSAHQVASFWFLHAVNSGLAAIRHLYLSKQGHPEELYVEMLRLGGALCTFGLDASPANLPVYDHLDLEACFEALDAHIREHLELLIPTNCVSISLEQTDRYIWEADVRDQRVFGTARWFFSIASNIGEAELITGTPALVKICSAKFVPELVKRALPGMRLTHVPSPPAALAPRIRNQYFSINRSGPCWDHLQETRRVGIYIPGDIPQPELELLVLLDS